MNTINDDLCEITNDLKQLEKEKNINEIMKKYKLIDIKIKTMNLKLQSLKSFFEEPLENTDDIDECPNIVIDEQSYDNIMKEITYDYIEKLCNNGNIENQIKESKNIEMKLNSCVRYLENKKTNIIYCKK